MTTNTVYSPDLEGRIPERDKNVHRISTHRKKVALRLGLGPGGHNAKGLGREHVGGAGEAAEPAVDGALGRLDLEQRVGEDSLAKTWEGRGRPQAALKRPTVHGRPGPTNNTGRHGQTGAGGEAGEHVRLFTKGSRTPGPPRVKHGLTFYTSARQDLELEHTNFLESSW